MLDHELTECFRAAEEVAKKAGEMIKSSISEEKRVELKSSIADLVTETDQQVEKLIFDTLRAKFPTHSFIGEETTSETGEKCNLTDNPTWVVDPVDGTTNFVHSFPFVAVSIALIVDKQIEIGIIYNPVLGDMYTARKGQGAFHNGKKIRVTQTEDLGKALVCTEFGSSREAEIIAVKLNNMRSIISKAHGIRSLGSAALNMSEVAHGQADAYFEFGVHCWDYAAAVVLIEEAGGFVCDTTGGPLDLMARRVLCAGTKKLAEEIAACIEQLELERD